MINRRWRDERGRLCEGDVSGRVYREGVPATMAGLTHERDWLAARLPEGLEVGRWRGGDEYWVRVVDGRHAEWWRGWLAAHDVTVGRHGSRLIVTAKPFSLADPRKKGSTKGLNLKEGKEI